MQIKGGFGWIVDIIEDISHPPQAQKRGNPFGFPLW